MTAVNKRGGHNRARLLSMLLLFVASLFSHIPHAHGQNLLPPGRIAFVRAGDVWVWQNGDSSRLVEDGHLSDPRWSPSATRMLYVRSGDSYSDLILRDFDTGSEQQLTFNQSSFQEGSPDYVSTSSWVVSPDWSASGLIGYASDATADSSMILWLINDPSTPPEAAPLIDVEDDVDGISLSADGSVAAYSVRGREGEGVNTTFVSLRDLTSGQTYVLADDQGGAFDPAFSPDGLAVAVAVRGGNGVTDIWLIDRATGTRTQVTSGAQAIEPSWSPDGKWLAYVRMVDAKFELWAIPWTGSTFGEPVRLFQYDDFDSTSRVSWTLS